MESFLKAGVLGNFPYIIIEFVNGRISAILPTMSNLYNLRHWLRDKLIYGEQILPQRLFCENVHALHPLASSIEHVLIQIILFQMKK